MEPSPELVFPYKVKSHKNDQDYWGWCCDTLVAGKWKMMIGFMGESSTYCFQNAEDATAFKLRFGL